jgi:hypothetical protein
MRTLGWPVVLLLISIVSSSVVKADTQYWRLSTDGLTVISDGSARRCEKLAFQFSDRRQHYRELAILMRQGTPADEAIRQAFALSLPAVANDFEDGRWRHDAVFKVPPPEAHPTIPAAQSIDPAQAQTALQTVADRVAQQSAVQ